MMTAISDGLYYLHPEGSCWIAARFSDGKLADCCYEADAGTHQAARDQWSDVGPEDTDIEVDADAALGVIRAVMSEDTSPEMVVVTKAVIA